MDVMNNDDDHRQWRLNLNHMGRDRPKMDHAHQEVIATPPGVMRTLHEVLVWTLGENPDSLPSPFNVIQLTL